MITYNDLYEALRKERYSEQLQVLPKNFVREVANYFEEKKEIGAKDDDFFSDVAIKSKKKLENAIMNFKELVRIRKKKILTLSFIASEVGISKKDFENLMGFEKDLFEEIVKSLEKSVDSLGGLMSGAKDESSNLLVRFLKNVPAFLDSNGNEIGPFEKGEVANLESDVVDILEKDLNVQIIEDV